MNTHADKAKENPNKSVAHEISKDCSNEVPFFQLTDNRRECIAQRKMQGMIDNHSSVQQWRVYQAIANDSSQVNRLRAYQEMAGDHSSQQQLFIQKKESNNVSQVHTKVIQREILPVEDPRFKNKKPEPLEYKNTVQGYINLLEYRKARQEWKADDKRTGMFDLVKEQARQENWEAAFKHIKDLVPFIKEGEEMEKTSNVLKGPVALKPDEVKLIRETAESDFKDAYDLLEKLAQDTKTLRAVFGDDKADQLKACVNMTAISRQLSNYEHSGNILIDESGETEASGMAAYNDKRGGGENAILMLTLAYAKLPRENRLGTLIHEASHGSEITATADIVYIRSWAGMAVTGKIALMNADSYQKAALLAQGKTPNLKILKGAGEEDTDRLQKILGWTDFRISQARSMANKLHNDAKDRQTEGRKTGVMFREVKKKDPNLYELSKALKLPWQEGRDPASTNSKEMQRDYEIKNIDRDLLGMFVNVFTAALAHLDTIVELKIVENETPKFVFGKELCVTTGALKKESNAEMGKSLASQVANKMPIPMHWKDAFVRLVIDLSTKQIAKEGENFIAVDKALS